MTPDAAGRPEPMWKQPERIWLMPGYGGVHCESAKQVMVGDVPYVPESEVTRLRAEVEASAKAVEALARAVLRYGWHDTDCPFLQDELPCTCDLEAIESTAAALLAARKGEG